MVLRISRTGVLGALSGVLSQIDGAGSNTPTPQLIVYSGPRPAYWADPITTQLALITYNIPNSPAFAITLAASPVDDGTGTLQDLNPAIAAASGTATFFRIINKSGGVCMEGDVTDSTGNGELIISTTNVLIGYAVKITGLTVKFSSTQQ